MARTDVRGYEINLIVLAMPVGDARPVQVVGRHLEVDLVADADADEIFAHFAGNMREHLMAVDSLAQDAIAYSQKNPNPEILRILQPAMAKPATH